MRHVFVETNFLVDALRPFAAPDAVRLLKSCDDGAIRLWLPWCCASEASRTLRERVIREDLGFGDNMMRFAAAEYRRHPGSFAKQGVDDLHASAKAAQSEALRTLDARILDLTSRLQVIPPSAGVVARTVAMFTVKPLKPFDDMVAAAVIEQAAELFAAGETDRHLCDLDGDIARPTGKLADEYAACGLNVIRGFVLP